MKYKPVIGLEVHLQTKTKSKMFCDCSADYFGTEPNTKTCPVCLGLPGALPTTNEKALEHCMSLALALNCKINKKSKFDRKNYFFPDLPKGYQISQYDMPIGYKGWAEVDIEGDSRRIRITRVHQEEDTGKTITEGDELKLDFNKSGVPLVEIVTEPDFDSTEEVTKFAKEIRKIVRYLNISDADMEKGQMRFELNMSLKKDGSKGLPDYKVEIKNIGSISVLEKVINFEVKRQSKILDSGENPKQETRGLVDMSGKTEEQRLKEDSDDYRYFPEPDIPPLEFTDVYIKKLEKSLPELPMEKKKRFETEYGLEREVIEVLTLTQELSDFFEKASSKKSKKHVKNIGMWIIGDLKSILNSTDRVISDPLVKIKPEHIASISEMVMSGKISGKVGKMLLNTSVVSGESPEEVVKRDRLEQTSSKDELGKVAKTIIKNNPKVATDYKNKNENALQYLVGQVMKETKGRANPKVAEKILKELLK
ncbi:MAG TPA: Asp-tRNA(Asn)/Glu-tRNA(Gln) amidotransferase subunit GatB [bacterium]|nr:Asp-tRNA(Asn)/Glu-tRNA(Gln) amidotransferase subunit GatB [bacterium]